MCVCVWGGGGGSERRDSVFSCVVCGYDFVSLRDQTDLIRFNLYADEITCIFRGSLAWCKKGLCHED